MDKLKEFFGLVKRQHFWFLFPVLLLLGVAGWYMSQQQLTSEFDTNKQRLTQEIDKTAKVLRVEQHPNQNFKDGMETLIRNRSDNVREAWNLKWERQKQVLVWPAALNEQFIRQVSEMRPIEKFKPGKGELIRTYRDSYRDYIQEELKALAESIGATWNVSDQEGGFAGRNRRPDTQRSEIVRWDSTNQTAIQMSRFDWGGQTPSTLQLLYAQEDLWVLQALIGIIKKTNGEALTRSQAAIKDIQFIQLGNDVGRRQGKVIRPLPLPAAGEESGLGEEAQDGGSVASDDPTGGFNEDNGAGEFSKHPANGRYVDLDYNPVPVADLLSASDSETVEAAKLAVAKRMPIRMRLVMDYRSINKLLVECCNAELTVDVRQVRMNSHSANSRSGSSFSGEGNYFRSATEGGRSGAPESSAFSTFDKAVELYGIVNIYNPVDNTKLGAEDAELAELAEDAAES